MTIPKVSSAPNNVIDIHVASHVILRHEWVCDQNKMFFEFYDLFESQQFKIEGI